MKNSDRQWRRHPKAVDDYLRQVHCGKAAVGGRFIFVDEAHQDRMANVLHAEGLEIIDSGQCEFVGIIKMEPTTENIERVCDRFVELARRHNLRLQSIEAGSIEDGQGHVLASEADYVPWWRVGDGNPS